MTPDHGPPVMTRAQRRTITGPHTRRRRFWINAALCAAAVVAAVAGFVVGCG